MRWRTAEFLNSRNTEVFAEYGADEKVRQAYTYGERGIGERISVDNPNLTNGTRKWGKGNKKMKFYGYEKDNERLMKLSEVTFDGTLEELEDLINFLKNVQEEHTKVVKKTDICHSHFRDWSDKWNKEDSDFIVVTRF